MEGQEFGSHSFEGPRPHSPPLLASLKPPYDSRGISSRHGPLREQKAGSDS